ncbi:hypothetical protein ASF73_01340 [Xanthomonas sp. Leaf131]|nr:hypothetical protein ASF73_01340 [Xanthomonas sp. Leaf131]
MLLCVPIGLVPVSLFIDFVPAAFLRFDLLFWPMTGMGAVLSVLLHKNARRHGRRSIVDQNSQLVTVFMICMTPLLLGALCYLLLCKTLPWLFTIAFGAPFEQAYLMRAHHEQDRQSCEYRLTGGPIEHGAPNYLCINEASYRRHPEQLVQVLLTGQRSALGMRIEKIYEQ